MSVLKLPSSLAILRMRLKAGEDIRFSGGKESAPDRSTGSARLAQMKQMLNRSA